MRTVLLLLILLSACGTGGPTGTLCERTFQPYPDMISGRTRTPANGVYLDAMALYVQHDYAGAKEGLKAFLSMQRDDKSAYIYLASCHLALGEPFDAELQLDHLERSNTLQFDDQIDWYTVVCWVCSDQLDRAREGAERIARSKAHTYSNEAAELLKGLDAVKHE
ncbi:MAG: hypothetical protein JNL43_14590 [Flavobacteriales bacterium]|nr:hypothetical protein [Flavobacteriales bacterium]